MIDNLSIFLPMTFLPGVGLFILSTSSRYIALAHQDMGAALTEAQRQCQRLDQRRGLILHLALALLYLSATLFSVAPLARIVVAMSGLFTTLLLVGVAATVAALALLFVESAVTLKSMRLRAAMPPAADVEK